MNHHAVNFSLLLLFSLLIDFYRMVKRQIKLLLIYTLHHCHSTMTIFFALQWSSEPTSMLNFLLTWTVSKTLLVHSTVAWKLLNGQKLLGDASKLQYCTLFYLQFCSVLVYLHTDVDNQRHHLVGQHCSEKQKICAIHFQM